MIVLFNQSGTIQKCMQVTVSVLPFIQHGVLTARHLIHEHAGKQRSEVGVKSCEQFTWDVLTVYNNPG